MSTSDRTVDALLEPRSPTRLGLADDSRSREIGRSIGALTVDRVTGVVHFVLFRRLIFPPSVTVLSVATARPTRVWNCLTILVTSAAMLNVLKQRLKTKLFIRCYILPSSSYARKHSV